jgi:hypothetical protein
MSLTPGGLTFRVVRVELAGAEGVVSFECDEAGRGEDVEVRVGPLVGRIEGSLALDLARLRDGLREMLSSRSLTGRASVESVEHDFLLRVEIANGKGTARGRVTTQFANDGGLTFELTTDQSYLVETLRQLDSAISGT